MKILFSLCLLVYGCLGVAENANNIQANPFLRLQIDDDQAEKINLNKPAPQSFKKIEQESSQTNSSSSPSVTFDKITTPFTGGQTTELKLKEKKRKFLRKKLRRIKK